MTIALMCFRRAEWADRLPHEKRHVEGEGGEQADVEEHDHHQVPLPGHPRPHQVLLQLNKQKYLSF